MKIKATILFVSLLLIFLNSCTETEAQSSTQVAENYWLQSPLCAFPCWKGIIRQQTKFDDVMPLVGNAKSPVKIITTNEIDFQFQNITGSTGSRASDWSARKKLVLVKVPVWILAM